jgi:hypothetical protein
MAAAPAFGQGAASHPYGLDPYKPSEAALLRATTSALTSETSVRELSTLDPYKPSDASLLRQAGGGLPVCCFGWGGPYGPMFGPATAPALTPLWPVEMPAPPRVEVSVVAMPQPPAAVSLAAPSSSGPTVTATFVRPTNNDGIWIRYQGQTWTSAGRAIPLQESERQRVGEYAGRPVYRLSRGGGDLIYVPSREGLFAPYRRKP